MAVALDVPWTAALASWVELSEAAIVHNAAALRRLLQHQAREGQTRRVPALGAVLKANAYGLGLHQLLPLLCRLVDAVFVFDAQEALAARAVLSAMQPAPATRLIVLGGVVRTADVESCVQHRLELVLTDLHCVRCALDWIVQFPDTLEPLLCHLHLDTGLSREGFLGAQLDEAVRLLAAAVREVPPRLHVVGIMTHFCSAEGRHPHIAQEQLTAFNAGARQVEWGLAYQEGSLERHLGSSGSLCGFPQANADMVRVGAALYGLWPSDAAAETLRSRTAKESDDQTDVASVVELRPVLTWKVGSRNVRRIQKGGYAGYGCTAPVSTEKESTVATFPVGYAQGYPRSAAVGGRACVLVRGRRCRVLHPVMMNHIIVDVTEAVCTNEDGTLAPASESGGNAKLVPVQEPLEAVLVGVQGDERVLVTELASWAHTIHYEITARLPAYLRREVVKQPGS